MLSARDDEMKVVCLPTVKPIISAIVSLIANRSQFVRFVLYYVKFDDEPSLKFCTNWKAVADNTQKKYTEALV